MILLLTLLTAISLFVPGLAVLRLVARRMDMERRFIVAPAITVVLYALAGLAGWVWPRHFHVISAACVIGWTTAGLLVLLVRGGVAELRRMDPLLPAAYLALVLFASQFVFLPIKVPKEFPGDLKYFYYVQRDVLPVRIQALYHHSPNDNLVLFRFAEFMLHGVDFRKPREWDNPNRPAIAPGQSVTARPPLMALVAVHYINLFGPREPVDGRYGKLGDLLTEEAYIPFFLAAVCLNALLMLPAYLLARHFAGLTAARLTMLLLACNAGLVINSNYTWAKALAGYFALLLAERVMTGRPRGWTIGLLAALSFYSHQCAMSIVLGACVYYFLTVANKRSVVKAGILAGIVGAVLLAPWQLWASLWIGDGGNLIAQNMYQNAELGWQRVLGMRLINILRTLAPHAVGTDVVPTPSMMFTNVFFTLPGMLGLLLVPFFGAALRERRFALAAVLMGLWPVIATAVTFGQSHGGLNPFGPFVFIPVATVMAVYVVVRLPRWMRLVLLVAAAEQIALIWYSAYVPQAQPLATWASPVGARLAGLMAVQAAVVILIAVVAFKSVARTEPPTLGSGGPAGVLP